MQIMQLLNKNDKKKVLNPELSSVQGKQYLLDDS